LLTLGSESFVRMSATTRSVAETGGAASAAPPGWPAGMAEGAGVGDGAGDGTAGLVGAGSSAHTGSMAAKT